ncbi:hypothetical protein [Lysinibacillus sp. RS5]|uniref:hypothetical protein n=1 Tax=unclassified Lysinibacillus TaxID=2636778 RepID=UPI0035BE22E8
MCESETAAATKGFYLRESEAAAATKEFYLRESEAAAATTTRRWSLRHFHRM